MPAHNVSEVTVVKRTTAQAVWATLPNSFLLLAFYTLAHGSIFLFPNAIFWDDWTLWHHSPDDILSTFEQAGAFLNLTGYIHVALLSLGPWAYTLLTFVLFFVIGVLLNDILSRHLIFTKDVRFFLLLFFLTTPLYIARVSMIMLPSTLSVFMFVMAWWLIDKHRLLSLALFLLCFNVQSLLMFYALPIFEWYFRTHKRINIMKSMRWAAARIDFILLPFIWFILKTIFFAPSELYANYNSVNSLERLLSTPSRQFADLLSQSLNLPIFSACLVLSFFAMRTLGGSKTTVVQSLILISLGLCALILALLPYWVLGHVPTFSEWTSRHQLLMPFGVSLILAAVLMAFPMKLRMALSMITLAIFLAKNLETYWMFSKDADKQEKIVSFLKSSNIDQTPTLFIFDDKTQNAISRRYRFYEWNGLMRLAFGTQSHFGINPSQITRYEKGCLDGFFSDRYNAENHERTTNMKRIVISIVPVSEGYKIIASTE